MAALICLKDLPETYSFHSCTVNPALYVSERSSKRNDPECRIKLLVERVVSLRGKLGRRGGGGERERERERER